MNREVVELLYELESRKIKIAFSEWNGKPSVTLWEGGTGHGYSYLLDAISELPVGATFVGIRITSTLEVLVGKAKT